MEGPRTKLDGAAGRSPRTPARHRLLWWRSCPPCQPPQAQGLWPQWGMRGQWAAARQEGWPPPPSGTRRTPGFLPRRSSLQSPWLSSQPGETRSGSYLDRSGDQQGHLTLRVLLSTSFWSGDSDGRGQGLERILPSSTQLACRGKQRDPKLRGKLQSSGSIPAFSPASQAVSLPGLIFPSVSPLPFAHPLAWKG